jgi:hypothetical protein
MLSSRCGFSSKQRNRNDKKAGGSNEVPCPQLVLIHGELFVRQSNPFILADIIAARSETKPDLNIPGLEGGYELEASAMRTYRQVLSKSPIRLQQCSRIDARWSNSTSTPGTSFPNNLIYRTTLFTKKPCLLNTNASHSVNKQSLKQKLDY